MMAVDEEVLGERSRSFREDPSLEDSEGVVTSKEPREELL